MKTIKAAILAIGFGAVVIPTGVALANCTATSPPLSGGQTFVNCTGPTGAKGEGKGVGNGSTSGTVTADLQVGTRTTANGLNAAGSTLVLCRGIDTLVGLGNRSAGATDSAGCEKMDKVFISVRQ